MNEKRENQTIKSGILVIDDSRANLDFLEEIISSSRYWVKTAIDAQNAFLLLTQHSFDLILLDIIMPHLDGFELCRRIKSKAEYKDIPVIFLTSKNDEESVVKGLSLGAVDFITKPFNKAELLARVKVHLKLKMSQKLLKQELLRRKEIEKELRQAYQETETTVQKRTRELQNEIQERIKTENTLKQKEQLLKLSQRIAKMGSWVYDLKKDEIWYSSNLYELFGVEKIEKKITLEKYISLIDVSDRCKFQDEFIKVLSGSTDVIKYKVLVQNSIKHFEHRFLIRKGNNENVVGLIGTVIDVTEQINSEESIRNQQDEVEKAYLTLSEQNVLIEYQKNQLQELNATKDKFFSIIAHDLKNPFQHILGFAELMNQEYESLTDEERQKFVGYIYSSSKHVFSLLENLLEWSRIKTERKKHNPYKFDMSSVVIQCVDFFKISAESKKITLKQEHDGEFMVFADHEMVNATLRNLINNAIKFTPENGEVVVSLVNEGDIIKTTVKDNGIGIPEKRLSMLFRLDENISTKGTNNETGTGLGLILCKEFVEKNAGSLTVDSQEGKGSVFSFTLPTFERKMFINEV